MLCAEGRVSLSAFLLSSLPVVVHVVKSVTGEPFSGYKWQLFIAVYNLLTHAIFYRFYYKRHPFYYQICWRAALLGQGFSIGLLVGQQADGSWQPFGWYLTVLSFFHLTEYLTTAWTNPKSLSLNSFLLNHSREYAIAAVTSWCEFFVERWLLPEMKHYKTISYIGLFLCLFGEVIRKAAMFTAGTNFNHIIQSRRKLDHVLVTTGVYGLWRHPSYVGWFWWSIGTQLILVNPLCVIGYATASWFFFSSRILEEEITLIDFFGNDYIHYQRRVSTGLPFIDGVRL